MKFWALITCIDGELSVSLHASEHDAEDEAIASFGHMLPDGCTGRGDDLLNALERAYVYAPAYFDIGEVEAP